MKRSALDQNFPPRPAFRIGIFFSEFDLDAANQGGPTVPSFTWPG